MKTVLKSDDWNETAIVATIGFFDGVHLGHRFLIDELKRIANGYGLPSAVITFPQHPRIVLQPDYRPQLLNSYDEKLELLAATGIDYTIVMDFRPELAVLSAKRFIEILAKDRKVKALLVGYDHRFGHNRIDGFEQYVAYGAEFGMDVLRANSYTDNGVEISSSRIRRLIESGNVDEAAKILGYPYRLKGCIVGGQKVGRSIGFPTANVAIDEPQKVLPANGAYAVYVTVADRRYSGMLYIGTRPTVDDNNAISIEVNIFDFSEDIYDRQISIEFIGFIREDEQFASIEDLKKQLEIDRNQSKKLLMQ